MAMTELDKAQATPKADWLKAAVSPQPIPAPAKAFDGAQPPWTLWEEANSIMASLDKVAAHIRHTRGELERNLMELERLIGSMPKRP